MQENFYLGNQVINQRKVIKYRKIIYIIIYYISGIIYQALFV